MLSFSLPSPTYSNEQACLPKGGHVFFVTLEDQRGVYEVVLFPDAYDRYGGLVFGPRTMRVTGRVEQDGQIKGEKLEALKK